MFKNLLKKPKMKDEMLEMKQNQYGARAFNMMIIIVAIVILIKAVVLEASISELWVELLLLIVGGGYYFYSVLKNNVPFMPTISLKQTIRLVFLISAIFGISVGIRNVFFLYADNMSGTELSYQMMMFFFISLFTAIGSGVIFGALAYCLYQLSKWQEKNIMKKIEVENAED
ncbi:hypothetical protein D3B05_01525 [Listeria monocytogenes]|uniref:DUF6773 family protein n=1 Tax=Listeria monocytogenes TaxID=1639 RepID=UPI000E6D10D9|nr:DUF6773 family protein [Listeria monocytogenes]EAD0678702.1 hypothetical protein [Listeria monocytogenes]EAD8594042.1 hypothetical protein [Listeria monocytogenes]EAF1705139.1 hypothetical protein [Listeria monocytogenes]EAW7112685.1 hypothetical protein [Listeria monocytogenes]EAW7162851.1 hypothetical protein [Listeria monocytogenes]